MSTGKAWHMYNPGGRVQALYRKLVRTRFAPSHFPYNITLSSQYKFLWFRVAKVGTRSIFHHLRKHVTLEVEHAHDLHYPPAAYGDYFKFAFVRNPWDRLVSCWKSKVLENNYFKFDDETRRRMISFGEFVDYAAAQKIDQCDPHLRAQSALVDLNQVDFLGRFETMDEDLNTVFARLDVPIDDMEVCNASLDKKDYRTFYTPELVEAVACVYARDIRMFGYRFD